MGVRGDFDKLRDLIHSTELLGSKTWKRELFRSLAEEAQDLVNDAFEQSRDPYGASWPASEQRRRGKGERGVTRRGRGQILRDTNRLYSSIHSRPSASGFVISTNVPYAAIHNFGGKVSLAERTELRAYKVTGRDKRTRVSLFGTKARRKVVTAVHAKARTVTVPRRMFIPPADNMGPVWTERLTATIRNAAMGVFK
jgi:phage virion morphogenesis protein